MPEEAEGADAGAVPVAEELEELVVLRALALLQVAQGRAELVVAEGRAVPVRPQVLGAEGGGAGQAGLHGRRPQAAVAADLGGLRPAPRRFILRLLFLRRPKPGAAPELLHHPAEHRVLLQPRATREGGPALRAAEVGRQPGPAELQAGGAEVVPAGNRHGAAEEAEADGAGQFLLQGHQARLRRRPGRPRHYPPPPPPPDPGCRCPEAPETKLGPRLSGNLRAPSPPPREGRQLRKLRRPRGRRPARPDPASLPPLPTGTGTGTLRARPPSPPAALPGAAFPPGRRGELGRLLPSALPLTWLGEVPSGVGDAGVCQACGSRRCECGNRLKR